MIGKAWTSTGHDRPTPLEPVRGVLLDMGDVLFDATVWRRWLLRLLRRMGLHARYRSFYHVWDHDYLNDVHRGRREYEEAFAAFLQEVGLTSAQVCEVQAASLARRRDLASQTPPLPGVLRTLAELKRRGLVLGVLSDSESPAILLHRRLDAMGFQGLFQVVESSLDLGHVKPEPITYLTAVARMQLDVAQVAFVGHDAEELSGATAVGMPTVAFNYEAGARADRYLDRFDDLLWLVGCHPHAASSTATCAQPA